MAALRAPYGVVASMPSPFRAIALLVFIAIPLLEIALLIWVGQSIGFWWTVLIVVGTAVIGTTLLHRQGLETLRRLSASARLGTPPVQPLVDGALLLAAGLLLLTPGLMTDVAGLLLLVPPVRALLARSLLSRVMVIVSGSVFGGAADDATPRRPGPDTARWGSRHRADTDADGGTVIEGEFERLDERDPKTGRRTNNRSEPPRR